MTVPIQTLTLGGTMTVPSSPRGLVLFAHGSGSSRFSPRNRVVAEVLQNAGFATLLFDLLTAEEEAVDEQTRELRFDIGLLTERLVGATDWAAEQTELRGLAFGYFGASTGAAAALMAAVRRADRVAAVVSRGGRPDLASAVLAEVRTPTLLIVGGRDTSVLAMNRMALARMKQATVRIEVVPFATHLFEEPGTLAEAARLASEWFGRFLAPPTVTS